MIKNALQYIVNLGKVETMEIEDKVYSTERLHPMLEPTHEPLNVSTLEAVVNYIKYNEDQTQMPYLIHIESPTKVSVNSPSFGAFNQRDTYLIAEPLLPSFPFGRFLDAEEFIISLQSRFVRNDDLDQILKVVGNVKEENVRSTGDDGVSQEVTAKTGIASVGNVTVPNPVSLQPYRTFIEVYQPEVKLVFRMQNGPQMALFEADGGAWRNQAIKNIKEHLSNSFSPKEKENIRIIA